MDWVGLIEELCQRVLIAERVGNPAVDLRDFDRPVQDDIVVNSMSFPRRHPSIIFGDGGTLKSYIGLWICGSLARQGMRTAYFDWELAGEDHRDRLERLFGADMPQILYAKCDRPLVHEVDRLGRIVRDSRIDYAIYDSVAFACDGPPEAAEVAGRYFRGVRQIGGGSLHVAHVSKAEGSDQKPFGSAFWHNGARSTWYAELDETSAGTDVLQIGLFNRKTNLGRRSQNVSYRVIFTEERTTISRADIAESANLAAQMSIRQRMLMLLRRGSMTEEEISLQLEENIESVKRTVRRGKDQFTVMQGGKIALLEKQRTL